MKRCKLLGPWRFVAAPLLEIVALTATLAFTVTAPSSAAAQTLVKLKAGMVTGIIRAMAWCGSTTDAIVVGIGYTDTDDAIAG